MKYVRFFVVVFVLFLAAYGGFALLKKPPQLNVPDGDIDYLKSIGIEIQDGQASEGGLSGVLNNVEGAPPIGVAGVPAGAKSSPAPPSFFDSPASPIPMKERISSVEDVAPPFSSEAAPLVAASPALPTSEPLTTFDTESAEYSVPVVTPAQKNEQPAAFPEVYEIKQPEPVTTLPGSESEIPKTEEQSFAKPVMPDISPPIPVEIWDGPVSDIKTVPSPPFPFVRQITPSDSSPQNPPGTKKLPRTSYSSIEESAFDSNRTAAVVAVPDFPPPAGQRRYESSAVISIPEETPSAVPAERAGKYKLMSGKDGSAIGFAIPAPVSNGKNAVVSFAPPKKITEQSVLRRTESIPAAVQPTQPSDMREDVVRFFEAQKSDAESNDGEKIRNAYIQLGKLFEHKQLKESERDLIIPVLDRLALDVVYSKNTHILEQPYIVQNGDTVETIAETFTLTPALLRKINGLTLHQQPFPGTSFKVVVGQFDAKISVQRKELTLLLGGLYAGRFPVQLGNQADSLKGEFYVVQKNEARVLTLNNGFVVGGSMTASLGSPGRTIRLQDEAANEVFDILAERSVVVFE
ncbi:hypothetical protein FACS189419_05830 [Planctomycetales bacterium]|nr:hypothetical protein FACS189419_05830 [Planctomycetales bacterium]